MHGTGRWLSPMVIWGHHDFSHVDVYLRFDNPIDETSMKDFEKSQF